MKLIKAIYDKNVYQDSLKEKFGSSFWNWILITVISMTLIFVSTAYALYKELPSMEEIVSSIPYFEIKDGLMSIEEGEEYITSEGPIIIDDEFVFIPEEFKYSSQYIIATRDTLYVKSENSEAQQVTYKDVDILANTNRDQLVTTIQENIPTEAVVVVILFAILILLLLATTVLVFKFVPIFVFALFGMLTGKIFKKTLTYSDSLKIMLYGSILPTILTTIYTLITGYNVHWSIYLIFILVYTGIFISMLNTKKEVKS